ncbi:MAG: hypothetical protein NUW06_01295 [Candidatus Acetothermia bacterium]|jgi:hypothetical protein|nr:hypothetical protein [Candidatus Acetothermia bacterium]MDH7505375.1 CARDB domain-containing protein [Candidatus Acetothermia bacterium]
MQKSLTVLVLAVLALVPLGIAQPAQPDLVVKEVRVEPADPEPGAPVQISAVVGNLGEGDAEAFQVQFKVDDLPLSRQRVRQLRAGRTVEVQAEWEAVEGEHRIAVEADRPLNDIEESDERNNSLQVVVTVQARTAISSLTDEITLVIGKTLRAVGEGLNFAIGSDLFAALEEGLRRLDGARLASANGGAKLVSIGADPPGPLAQEEILRGGRAVGQIFLELADSLAKVGPALQSFNLDAGIAALREAEAELLALSRLSLDRVRLGPLALAAQHLEEAAQATLALAANLSGSSGQSLEELLAPIQAALAKAGEVIVAVATEVEGLSLHRGIVFSDATNRLPAVYRPGEPLTIQVYGAAWLNLEVYDPAGRLVARRVVIDDRLLWRGDDNRRRPLPAGPYFYRLTADRGAGEEKDLGRLMLTAPSP